MRFSQYFIPTLRETPKEADVASHQFMLRAGMIQQTSAGIYAWLPLGLRVLKKVEQIVREEQNAAGAQEMLMPTLQPADLWRKSGRYDAYGKEMLRIKDRHDRDLLYGPTNEDMIHDIFGTHVKSYKGLPKILYHIQWKFRDEIRPRFGLMRGREFMMKDGYSFDLTKEDAVYSYHRMMLSYLRTFSRMGIKAIPMRADTGPIGGDLSHEFIILAETGESEVFVDQKWLTKDLTAPGLSYHDRDSLQKYYDEITGIYAATDEIHKPESCPVPADQLVTKRGIEVGHIFYYGSKYAVPMETIIQNENGEMQPIQGGCYGIGVSRVVASIIEASHDDAGIIWPEPVAPFAVGLINLKTGDATTDSIAARVYDTLQQNKIEVLYDDRDERAGVKFADMDLIGLPWQVIVGPKGAANGMVEIKNRKSGERQELSVDAALTLLKEKTKGTLFWSLN